MENTQLNKIVARAENLGLVVTHRVETLSTGNPFHYVDIRRPQVEVKNYLDLTNNCDSLSISSYFNEYTKRWNTTATRHNLLGDNTRIKQRSIDFYIRLFANVI